MALAYAVVLVNDEALHRERHRALQDAQAAADGRFEQIAIEARLTKVLRMPEPRTMSPEELRKLLPYANLDGLTGLYFEADIT